MIQPFLLLAKVDGWMNNEMTVQHADAFIADNSGEKGNSEICHEEADGDNILAVSRLHNVVNTEESGVYFDDGVRKTDFVLAFEGKGFKWV